MFGKERASFNSLICKVPKWKLLADKYKFLNFLDEEPKS